MAPSSRAKPIDDGEWERHKTQIEELYRRSNLKVVIDKMARKGFVATRAQYEAKFRDWNIYKYKRQEANKSRSRKIQPRMLELNNEAEPVSPRYNDANQVQGNMTIPFAENAVGATSTSPSTNIQGIASSQKIHLSGGENDFGHGFDVTNSVEAAPLPNWVGPFSQQGPNQFDLMDLVESSTLPPGPDGFDFTNWVGPALSSPGSVDFEALIRLPQSLGPNDFTRNTTSIPSNNSSLSEQRNWVGPLASIQVGAMIIKSTYRKSLVSATPNTLARINNSHFLYELSNIATKFGCSENIQIPTHLYSNIVFIGEDWSQLSEITEASALEARVDVRLISSVINGYAGLGNIPHAGAVEFLQRNCDTQIEVFKYLDNQSSPISKSFTENLFSAFIESDELPAVIYLLNKKLVDVDKAVCHFFGERYTALEYAAVKQSFKVVEYLISQMDVNKSFSRADQSNALELLIYYVADCRSTLEEKFLQLVDDFLESKAIVSVRLVRMVLTSFVDARLVCRLLKILAAQTPSKLFSEENLLRDVVKNLEEQDAIEIMESFIDKCREPSREWYLYQFQQQVDVAFDSALERDYNQLAKIMLPHASSPYKSLQTAMNTHKQDAIQFILEKNPGLNSYLSSEKDIEDSATLFSALKSKDHNAVRCLEETGVLNSLRGHNLGQALTEALRAGNRECAIKIMDLDPNFDFYSDPTDDLADHEIFDVSAALRAALAHDFDDIAWKLLSVGLVAEKPHFRDLRPPPLLYVAVETKKPDFIGAIIQSGFSKGILGDEKWPILELVVESGQDSIFDDLWKIRPSYFCPTENLLNLALEKGREDWFLNMIESCEDNYYKTRGLKVAVEYGAEWLFDKLISLGARADDDSILRGAIKNHPKMVKPLLDRYWKSFPQGRAGYGWFVIRMTLTLYPNPFYGLSVDQLFTWNLVNQNHVRHEQPGLKTILARAIGTRNYDIVKKFIDADSEVNYIMDDEGYLSQGDSKTTALLAAIEAEVTEIVQLLVERGANVNQAAELGIRRTPLQKAAELDNIAIVTLLLDHGAEVNSIPAICDGGTALQFAAINGNCEMARILIQHGARNDIPPPRGIYGRWPLEGAAENGRFDMIELLWKVFGPFSNEQCQSAMRYAERHGHYGCKEKIEDLMATSCAPNMLSTSHSLTLHSP
ncbi:hypothetical protein F4679DRAFT_586036 [Xylaria curta]|nr:hypothetical protein F4679DRAFT_586036 [Xylaria curta]